MMFLAQEERPPGCRSGFATLGEFWLCSASRRSTSQADPVLLGTFPSNTKDRARFTYWQGVCVEGEWEVLHSPCFS